MKSVLGNNNNNSNNTSINSSLRKFRTAKYFEPVGQLQYSSMQSFQRGYETENSKRDTESKVAKHRIKLQNGQFVQEKQYQGQVDNKIGVKLRDANQAGKKSIKGRLSSQLDYASDVDLKIKVFEKQQLAGSSGLKQLQNSPGGDQFLNLRSPSFSSSKEVGGKQQQQYQQLQHQFKFQPSVSVSISQTPYRSPTSSNKKALEFESLLKQIDDFSLQDGMESTSNRNNTITCEDFRDSVSPEIDQKLRLLGSKIQSSSCLEGANNAVQGKILQEKAIPKAFAFKVASRLYETGQSKKLKEMQISQQGYLSENDRNNKRGQTNQKYKLQQQQQLACGYYCAPEFIKSKLKTQQELQFSHGSSCNVFKEEKGDNNKSQPFGQAMLQSVVIQDNQFNRNQFPSGVIAQQEPILSLEHCEAWAKQKEIVRQQQQQIAQYQQELEQQKIKFQLFIQEQKLISQQQRLLQQSSLLQQSQIIQEIQEQQWNIATFSSQNLPQKQQPIIINNNLQNPQLDGETNNYQNLNSYQNNQGQINHQSAEVDGISAVNIAGFSENKNNLQILGIQSGSSSVNETTPVGLRSPVTKQIDISDGSKNSSAFGFAGNSVSTRASSQRRKWDISGKSSNNNNFMNSVCSDDECFSSLRRELSPSQRPSVVSPFIPVRKPVRLDIFWDKNESELNKKQQNIQNPQDVVNENKQGIEKKELQESVKVQQNLSNYQVQPYQMHSPAVEDNHQLKFEDNFHEEEIINESGISIEKQREMSANHKLKEEVNNEFASQNERGHQQQNQLSQLHDKSNQSESQLFHQEEIFSSNHKDNTNFASIDSQLQLHEMLPVLNQDNQQTLQQQYYPVQGPSTIASQFNVVSGSINPINQQFQQLTQIQSFQPVSQFPQSFNMLPPTNNPSSSVLTPVESLSLSSQQYQATSPSLSAQLTQLNSYQYTHNTLEIAQNIINNPISSFDIPKPQESQNYQSNQYQEYQSQPLSLSSIQPNKDNNLNNFYKTAMSASNIPQTTTPSSLTSAKDQFFSSPPPRFSMPSVNLNNYIAPNSNYSFNNPSISSPLRVMPSIIDFTSSLASYKPSLDPQVQLDRITPQLSQQVIVKKDYQNLVDVQNYF